MDKACNGATVSRRAFLKSIGLGLTLLASAPILQACGPAAPPSATQAPAPKAAEPTKAAAAEPTKAPAAEPTKAAAAEPTKAPVSEPTQAPAAPTPAPQAGPKGKLRFVAMDYDERMQKDTDELMAGFNSSQDKYEAKAEVVKWGDGFTVLTTQVGAGQAPDIANISAGWLLQFNAASEVEPLGSYIPEDFLKDFVPAALGHMTIDGNLMAMPYFEDSRGLYYRTDMFEKAGLKPPTTWDEVREAAKKLNNPPDVYGIGQALPYGDYWWYAWIGAMGGEGDQSVWSPEKKCLVGGEAGVSAVQFLVDIILNDKTSQPTPINADRDADLQPLFLSGKLAMLATGPWMPIIIQKNAPNIQFDVAPLPVAKPGMKPGNVAWPDAVVMYKQSKDKEAAAELIRYIYSKENRLAFTKQRGNPPERADVAAEPSFGTTKYEKFFFEQTKVAHNVYQSPWPADYDKDFKMITDNATRAALGEISAKEAMESAADAINKSHGF